MQKLVRMLNHSSQLITSLATHFRGKQVHGYVRTDIIHVLYWKWIATKYQYLYKKCFKHENNERKDVIEIMKCWVSSCSHYVPSLCIELFLLVLLMIGELASMASPVCVEVKNFVSSSTRKWETREMEKMMALSKFFLNFPNLSTVWDLSYLYIWYTYFKAIFLMIVWHTSHLIPYPTLSLFIASLVHWLCHTHFKSTCNLYFDEMSYHPCVWLLWDCLFTTKLCLHRMVRSSYPIKGSCIFQALLYSKSCIFRD